mgnify:CR=1 FL=1
MDVKLIWLTGFVGIYWAYCLFWGFKGARDAKTSTDYFLAGRSIGVWVFVLSACISLVLHVLVFYFIVLIIYYI